MLRPSHRFSDAKAGAALTGRQREIVVLIADGLTNQAIADQLGLDRLAVSQQVATILWRLGLSGRHQIAVWAIGQDWRAQAL